MTEVDRRLADAQFDRIVDDRDVRIEFQPIVHMQSGAIVGYEALLRGPEGSVLTSAESLLAAAHRAGRLVELDWIARSRACRAALDADLDPDLFLLLNIEPIALDSECPRDLWPDIERGFDAFRVVLEVTERSLDRDPGTLLDGIERQRPVVAGIALDDVGTQPATVAMLPLVSPALIKIDQPLVQSPPTSGLARVLNAVQGQANRSGAIILAEGVETDEHERQAIAYGAQLAQGHRFGQPGPLPRGRQRLGQVVAFERTPPAIVDTPFEALSGRAVGPAGEDLVDELARYVAASADQSMPTLHINLMLGPDRLDASALDRLAQLVRAGTFAAVLGPGIPAEPGHGIRGTGQRNEPQPTGEWAAITIGPSICTAVLARRALDGSGRWEYGITHDWSSTVAAARCLVRLLGAPEPRFRFAESS